MAQIGTSSGDASVLSNFPQEVDQALRQEVERLLVMLAKKDAKLAFETEWSNSASAFGSGYGAGTKEV